MFSQPFDVEPECANGDFQMKIIELQSNEFYKSKRGATGTTVIEFYKKYVNENKSIPNLIDHAKIFICMFGSTYISEQLFSKMKYVKSKSRLKLIDGHLDLLLKLAYLTNNCLYCRFTFYLVTSMYNVKSSVICT